MKLMRIEIKKNETIILIKWNLTKNISDTLSIVKEAEKYVLDMKKRDLECNEYSLFFKFVNYRTIGDKISIIKRKMVSFTFSIFRLKRCIENFKKNKDYVLDEMYISYLGKLENKYKDLDKVKNLSFLNIQTFSVKLSNDEEVQVLKFLRSNERVKNAS